MFRIIPIIFFLLTSLVLSSIFRVGPDKQYKKPSEVMSLVADGDTVEIDAGSYDNDAGIWRNNDLLIKGINGYVKLKAPPSLPQKKAIWIVQGDNNRIEYIEFSFAKVPDKNGAGIRFEGTNLSVTHCRFLYNEDGILTGANQNSTVVVEFCEFGYNGYGNGYSHNLYIGTIRKFVFRYNYTHHANVGHCIKSRAQENIILHNRIMDENDGNASYLINLPNGGLSYIAGNLLMQSPNAQNSKMIDYGSEGYKNNDNRIYIYNNTLVNKRNPGIFVNVVQGADEVIIKNNIFAGYSAHSTNALPLFADTSNNLHQPNVESLFFLDEPDFDYRLTSDSPAVDRGANDIEIPEYDNFLALAYQHPADSMRVIPDDEIDIGAYQFEKPNTAIEQVNDKHSFVYYHEKKLYIYPIPTESGALSIQIYDLGGRLVASEDKTVSNSRIILFLGAIKPGVYLYRIATDNKVITGKFNKF